MAGKPGKKGNKVSRSSAASAPPEKKDSYDPVRAACVEVLRQVLDRGHKSDAIIAGILAKNKFSDLDRRFLLQLCHGVIKMKRRLDYIYRFYLERPADRIDPITRQILRLGLYQLIFTDRIPAGAAVSEAVNLARGMVHHSRGSFVNAILRNFLRRPEKVVFPDRDENPVEYLGLFYSYPEWFVKYCIDEFAEERTEELLKRGNRAPTLTYRINPLLISHQRLQEKLAREKITYHQGKYLPDFYHIEKSGLPLQSELLTNGRVYVQDEAAGMAVHLLNPRPRDHVIDLASAPGGKATYLGILMKNQGMITAVDINQQRLEILVENARRMGIQIIAPVLCDIMDFRGPTCDFVLLDTLCSGWGVLAKNSDLRWSKSREDSTKLARMQSKLIWHAADLVNPGGVLVYSTCTILREENDQIIEEFLLENKNFKIDSAANYFPAELVNERGFLKTYPNIEGLDGHFCVRLKKKVGPRSKKS